MPQASEVVVVTGVGGLIGAAVARQLVARGEAAIGLDRQQPTAAACPVLLQEIGDVHRLHEIMSAHRVRAIVHAGGASGPMVSPESPARVAAINIGGLIDVLEVARIHRIPRLVWFSSILAYGPRPDATAVDEASVLRPTTVYGASKAAGEALLQAYAAEHGVVATALRVASCYGPGRTTNCFIRLLVENALAGRPTAVPFPDAPSRQHIHIDDVAAAVLAVLAVPHLPSAVYNIAPGLAQTSREVAAQVGIGVPGVALVTDPAAPDWNSFSIGPLAIDRARHDFGFAPRVSLSEGAQSYVAWLRQGP